MSNSAKDAEILTLRPQITVPERLLHGRRLATITHPHIRRHDRLGGLHEYEHAA